MKGYLGIISILKCVAFIKLGQESGESARVCTFAVQGASKFVKIYVLHLRIFQNTYLDCSQSNRHNLFSVLALFLFLLCLLN